MDRSFRWKLSLAITLSLSEPGPVLQVKGNSESFGPWWSYLFICLCQVLIVAHGIFCLCCGMWDLVPWPGIKLRPPALRAQSLSHWTTRKVPGPWLSSAQNNPQASMAHWRRFLLNPFRVTQVWFRPPFHLFLGENCQLTIAEQKLYFLLYKESVLKGKLMGLTSDNKAEERILAILWNCKKY